MDSRSNATAASSGESLKMYDVDGCYPLRFASLTFNANKNDIIIGRPDIASYAAFDFDDAELVRQLCAGLSPQDAAEWYYHRYGEAIDMDDFLHALRELRFVLAADEEYINRSLTISPFLRWAGRVTFSPVAWVVYTLLFGYCLYLIFSTPQLLPTRNQLLFSPYISVVEVGLLVGQLAGLFIHEGYHCLAGMRLGIVPRISIGYRAYFVVIETDLTGLWGVPKRSRFLPLLAGMLADLITFSVLIIAANFSIHAPGNFALIAPFCEALAFSTLLRLLWQFNFYLRTDIYFVLTYLLGCLDLQHTTRRFLRNCFLTAIGRTHECEDETHWPLQDRKVVAWYAWIYILGYGVTIGMFLFVSIPVFVQVAYEMYGHLFTHPNPLLFWDSLITLLVNVLQLGIVIFLMLKYRTRRKRALRSNSLLENTITIS